MLNRVFRWDDTGVTYEADPRHAEIIISELGRASAHAVSMPRHEASSNVDCESLSASEATMCRALAARANYLAVDRADIHHSLKEIA